MPLVLDRTKLPKLEREGKRERQRFSLVKNITPLLISLAIDGAGEGDGVPVPIQHREMRSATIMSSYLGEKRIHVVVWIMSLVVIDPIEHVLCSARVQHEVNNLHV